MSVTLEVSKLSGWLNADAPCRESKGGHTVRDEVRERRVERMVCDGEPDAGREAERCVGRRDASGMHARRARLKPGG